MPLDFPDEEILTGIYSAFEPFRPPDEDTYVDFEEVRGGWNVWRELGRRISRAKGFSTCQLYSGHRGVGKSTELLRLKEALEQRKYQVVYFAADEQDIEPQDAEYAFNHRSYVLVYLNWLQSRFSKCLSFGISCTAASKFSVLANTSIRVRR